MSKIFVLLLILAATSFACCGVGFLLGFGPATIQARYERGIGALTGWGFVSMWAFGIAALFVKVWRDRTDERGED